MSPRFTRGVGFTGLGARCARLKCAVGGRGTLTPRTTSAASFLTPATENIPSSSHTPELSALSVLPFSLLGASPARPSCVGFRVAFTLRVKSLSGYTSRCHCGLTQIRHSPAQVNGRVIRWCGLGVQSQCSRRRQIGVPAGFRAEDVSCCAEFAVQLAGVSTAARLTSRIHLVVMSAVAYATASRHLGAAPLP